MSKSDHTQVTVRLAHSEDVATIAKFTGQIALETEDVMLDAETVVRGVENGMMNSKYGFYVVAEIDREIAGCLMITYEWSDWRNGVQWWLQSVYVKPECRGIGVFKKLYNFVLERAAEESNVCGIRLYVDESNSDAISTYKKLGLTRTNYLLFEKSLIN